MWKLALLWLVAASCAAAETSDAQDKARKLLHSGLVDAIQPRDGILDIGALASRQPVSRQLLTRQQLECPAGYYGCNAVYCCPTSSNCRPDFGPDACCPSTAQTCGGFACALAGYVCCDQYVCEPGTQCGSGFGECITGTVTRSATQTRQSTSTSTSTGTSTRTSTASSVSTGACGGKPTPGALRERQSNPSLTNPGYCSKVCNVATKEEMAVLTIPKVVGRTDELIRSTCLGMQERSTAGEVKNQMPDGEDILTYNGPNNRQTQGSGLRNCQQENRDNKLNKINQCDEYPPGAFNQNPERQTFTSIPAKQNSGTQGPMLRNLVRQCGLKENDKVLFKVEGGCSQHLSANAVASPAVVRRDTWSSSGSSADLWDPFNDASLTYIFMDLGELDDGHYNFNVNFDGDVESVEVLDNSGDVFARQDSPGSSHTLSFDLSGGINSGMALVAYTNNSMSVSYTSTRQLANGTTNGAKTVRRRDGSMTFVDLTWLGFNVLYILLA